MILRGNVKRGEGLVIQSLNLERAARSAARDSLDFLDTLGSSGSHPYSCEEMLDMGSGWLHSPLNRRAARGPSTSPFWTLRKYQDPRVRNRDPAGEMLTWGGVNYTVPERERAARSIHLPSLVSEGDVILLV